MSDPVAQVVDALAGRFDRRDGVRVVRAPYRVCPLGAHVDHQDGVVTGMAIDKGVLVAFAPRDDTRVRAASADFTALVEFDLRAVPPAAAHGDWGNFLRGAAVALARSHPLTRGADLYVAGQLPIGGLSSSAAVSVGYLLALQAVNDLSVAPEENIALARAIENDYVSLRSGILDQSMILLSQQDRLLRFDCRTLDRSFAPFGSVPNAPGSAPSREAAGASRAAPPTIGVAYSGVSHALVGTGYNQRVAECREAAALLLAAAGLPVPEGGAVLRDVPPDAYAAHQASLPPNLAKRAAHYFGEQERVEAGVAAWAAGDITRLGQLVTASGRSSIDNYECGAPELIAIYNALVTSPGVCGARFSGAGFRGSCLALVAPEAFHDVGTSVRAAYLRAFPQYADTFGFFACASAPAAGFIQQ
jgi:galactokinase